MSPLDLKTETFTTGANPDFRALFLIRSFHLERQKVKVISLCGIIKRHLEQDFISLLWQEIDICVV